MKKMTQDDIDAGLTQADVDLGLRGKVTKGGSDASMRSRMASEKYDSPSVVDQYRDFKKNPSAKTFPVADRSKIKETSPEAEAPKESKRTSNDAIGDLVKKLGSGRVGTTPSSFAEPIGARKGGAVKMAKGGSVSSASRRADGCATKGKTKGRMI